VRLDHQKRVVNEDAFIGTVRADSWRIRVVLLALSICNTRLVAEVDPIVFAVVHVFEPANRCF
jgi:hypothetical protein